MRESHWHKPQARGCGGPRRQEEKEEAASPLAHAPHPCPHLWSQEPSKQDGGGGREDWVRAQALALAQPCRLGEEALLQD